MRCLCSEGMEVLGLLGATDLELLVLSLRHTSSTIYIDSSIDKPIDS